MWFFEDSFFQRYIEPINQVGGQGAGGQAKQAVVNEVWERGEIVMCIAILDTCILAESNQLIKYLSLINHRLRP